MKPLTAAINLQLIELEDETGFVVSIECYFHAITNCCRKFEFKYILNDN